MISKKCESSDLEYREFITKTLKPRGKESIVEFLLNLVLTGLCDFTIGYGPVLKVENMFHSSLYLCGSQPPRTS